MSKKHDIKKQNYEKRQEEKANRVFKMVCIFLLLIGILLGVAYGLAS